MSSSGKVMPNRAPRVLRARGCGGKGGRTDQLHNANQQRDARKLASEFVDLFTRYSFLG